ncbi:MAG: hypothetical protein IJ833_08475 [Lachnospiraceae bacterium]|nr:hypothetical protein [Lachnospiraceae bacterium]
MKKYIEKYGGVNCIIVVACTAVLFINSIAVDKKIEIVYLIIFFLSLVLGIESLVTHLIALFIGLLVGLLMKKES